MSFEPKQTLADSAADDPSELRVTDAANSTDDCKGGKQTFAAPRRRGLDSKKLDNQINSGKIEIKRRATWRMLVQHPAYIFSGIIEMRLHA